MKKPTAKRAAKTARTTGNETMLRGEEAYQRVMEGIQSGELKPGTRVRETDLAEWLGSSRTPAREALNRLLIEGLVVQEARRGMVIAQMDSTMIAEIYYMREMLEVTAARLAARHASDVEISMLRDLVERDKEQGDDPVRRAKNHHLFHDSLYRAAHNRYLLKMANSLQESLALLGRSTLTLSGRAKEASDEHDAIVTAIERHDADAAEAACRTHIRSSHRARVQMMFEQIDP